MGYDAILSLIWKARFPIVCCALAGVVWLGWSQYKRGNEWKDKAEKAEIAYKAVIEHGQKIQTELAEREKQRIQREEENDKRWQRIKRLLEEEQAREWANTPIPQSVVDGLRVVLPEVPNGAGSAPVATGGSR